jgi:hypothetical protein
VTCEEERTQLEQGLISAIQNGIESFHISDCLNCFKQYKNVELSKIVDLFLTGVIDNNEIVRKFSYLDENVDNLKNLSVPKEHV